VRKSPIRAGSCQAARTRPSRLACWGLAESGRPWRSSWCRTGTLWGALKAELRPEAQGDAVDADTERVNQLVARPGWWINEDTITDNLVATDGDISTVSHPEYGEFRIRTVAQEPPRYAAYRWLGGEPANEGLDVPGTLVEFRVEGRAGGGVTLRVVESGFSGLPGTEEDRRKNHEDNSSGWELELEAARSFLEAD
jgi:hypothetical protein